jgi:N-methylhydantoinase A
VSFRVTADVGGTFTDVVVADDSGHLTVGKAPSSRARIFEGVQAALADAAGQLSIAPSALLGEANLFVYSTTHATNAIIEGATARTAFLTTDGFPDILVRREGGKLNPFDFTEPYPASYVPRRLTFEIRERVDAEGGVTTPLDVEQARSVLRRLDPLGVEAIAVCLLWSIANPAHELLLGELIEEELPGVAFTLSHQLNPIIREYRRASSTAIDASLKPLMQRHFGEFESDLRHTGFTGELVAAISVGGVMHIGDVIERPIYSVKSGPAMAPIAGRVYADAEAGQRNVIVCDTGGTSFDVSLVRDGMLVFTRETWLGPRFTGHLTGLSSVDVRSFGAGGGSIAWIDPGGLLRVGPASAGADPGPACYGRGGTQATVTDAAAVLGYLNPEFFLGGSMPLDVEASRTAVGALAEVLAIGVEETAQAIVAVANEHMIEAIKQLTVNEGIDPRESLIVAGGGAAGMNIVPIARELGCKRVLVPRTAGALSACGAQYSDIVAEFGASSFTTTAEFDFEAVNAALREIDALIEEFFSGLHERGFSESRTEYFVEARYPAQVWDLELPLRSGGFGHQADVDELARDFHTGHKRVFAVAEPDQYVELLQWKGRLTVPLSKPALERSAAASSGPAGQRRAVFAGVGEVAASTYRGDMLAPGMKIDGPAVIEEATTTIVVYPGSCATVTPLGNYLLEL